jgi:hypothetical protein
MVDETLHRVYPSEVYMYDQSKVVIIEEQNQGMRTSTKSILSICMLAYIIFFFKNLDFIRISVYYNM